LVVNHHLIIQVELVLVIYGIVVMIVYKDKMTDQQYIDWTIDVFRDFDKALKKDGLYYIICPTLRKTHI